MPKSESDPVVAGLLDVAARCQAGSWLVLGGSAELVMGIAGDHPGATVTWQPVDVREQRAIGIRYPALRIVEPGTPVGDVGAVAFVAPPDRALARRWLLVARDVLGAGGVLFVAGLNSEGIRSVIADAARVFGPAVREDYRAKGRIATFTGGDIPVDEPAWLREPGVAPGTWQDFRLQVGASVLSLVTQAGVFAGAHVDAGTQLLLDALPDQVTGAVLDIGCGAGALGLAAARLGADRVDLTDANLPAVQAAAENIRRLGLTGCRAVAGDVYDAIGDERYDLIVSNPPFHRGKTVDTSVADRLINGAPDHLTTGGTLVIVANAFLAYGKRMERVFRRVETVTATRRYQVLRAREPRR